VDFYFQDEGANFRNLASLRITNQGQPLKFNEEEDWVMYQIELLNHNLSPPPLETGIEQTLKVHIFGYPAVGNLLFNGSKSDNEHSGTCIQAEVSQIKQGHFLINANSHNGLSGAAVVCDRSGGILGIVCGQWKDFQGFAVSIHQLPKQKRYSPPTSPDDEKRKKCRSSSSSSSSSKKSKSG
jgi:hypothetical protein